jgi:hypothetical protein
MITIRSEILAEHGGVEAFTLENRYVRVTLVPAWGSPVSSLFDKRSATELLAAGSRLSFGDPADTAPWQCQTRDGAASLFRVSASGLTDTWAVVTLTDDSPWIQFDVQFHNRSLVGSHLGPVVGLPDGDQIWDAAFSQVVVKESLGAGALVRTKHVQATQYNGWEAGAVFPSVLLGGRTARGRVALAPFGGIGPVHGVGREWVASWPAGSLVISAQAELGAVELHVQTTDGQTLKAGLDLSVATTTVVSTAGLPPADKAALVLNGEDLGRIFPTPLQPDPVPCSVSSQVATAWKEPGQSSPEMDFRQAASSWLACNESPMDPPTGIPGSEHVVATIEAMKHARGANWEAADDAIDQALTTNGDDPLLWWAKAAVARHRGEDDEALTNAHYLLPMEPMLRVEAFLRQDQTQGAEANPLLAAVATDQAAARDCLARLAVWGLWTDFARLADELLRHRDDAVVRYLLAWSYMTRTRMTATAAEHVAAAARLSVDRQRAQIPVLQTAIQALSAAFPADSALKTWSERLS